MAKGNPSPKKPAEWDQFKKPKHDTLELAKKPIAVRFSVEADEALRAMGSDRQEFVRKAVNEALFQQKSRESSCSFSL
ncbi:MAG: hypothetical protein AAF889_00100 [Cyanobacteria bacterium P01_D01_bin.73]